MKKRAKQFGGVIFFMYFCKPFRWKRRKDARVVEEARLESV